MNLVIVGMGYVGLVTGTCMAELGDTVIGIDNNVEKIEMLNSGKSPIYEPELEKLIRKNKERLFFTNDYIKSFENAEIIFIAVGTPENQDGSANLEYVYDVVTKISNFVKKDCVIVIKSTVPIGTNKKIEEFLKSNLKSKVNIEVVSNPEFLSQGTAVKDTLQAQRIVLGVESINALNIMKKVYDKFKQPYIITNRESAEMIKYASNSFLALKISYINEIANLCEKVGANVDDVAKGMGADSRIGNQFLRAGIGYGGSCFPKDTRALMCLSNEHKTSLLTVKAAIDANEYQRKRIIEKSRKYVNDFYGVKVAILGTTFKPNTDDIRESPAIQSIEVLLNEGAIINAYNPIENYVSNVFQNKITYVKDIENALINADICMIFTEWQEIKEMNPLLFEKLMKRPIVIDGRNCFEVKKMKDLKIIYESIGRECINNLYSIK